MQNRFLVAVKNQLKARYKDVAGRIITMALDSVDYSEEKACKILEIVMQDDKSVKNEIQQRIKEDASVENESGPQSRNQNELAPDVTANTDERYFRFFHSIGFCSFYLFLKFAATSQITAQ